MGHPERFISLNNLSSALTTRFDQSRRPADIDECMELWESASVDPPSYLFDRLEVAVRWSEAARLQNHSSTLKAYTIARSLLQRALTISPTLEMQHDLLTDRESHPTLALDAASYAVKKSDLKKAAEMLEQGRGLLWSQMRGFRTPLEKLAEVNKPLADRFKKIGVQLEVLSTSSEERSPASSADGSIATVQADQRLFDER